MLCLRVRSAFVDRNDLTYLLQLLAIKEVAQQLLDARDTGGTADQDNFVNLGLVKARILDNLLDGVKCAAEGLGVEVLETSTSDLGVEVLTVEKRVNLDSGLRTVGQGSLSTLTGGPESSESTGIARKILLRLSGELLLEVVEEIGIEILTTQVGITSGGLDGEDTTLDVQERHIEGTATEIVDENVTFFVGFSGSKTVGDGSRSRLVDDTEDIETCNGTCVLCGLTLVVVEISRDSDDGLGDLLAKFNLGNLLHL